MRRLGAIQPPAAENRTPGWFMPGPGNIGILLVAAEDCRVGVSESDPAVLRQTLTERLSVMPGVTRGNASGMEDARWAAIDLWCVNDAEGRFAIVVSTAAARQERRPSGMLRFARLEPDNQRCPPSP